MYDKQSMNKARDNREDKGEPTTRLLYLRYPDVGPDKQEGG